MTDLVILTATMRAKPGREEELGRRLHALIAPTRAEAGCVIYDLHRSTEDQAVWMFYEVWRTKDDLERHGQSPHLTAFKATADEVLAEPMTLTFFRKVEG